MVTFYEAFRGEKRGHEALEKVELTERERMVWDRAHKDALKHMRFIATKKGFIARGVRLGPVDPDPDERERFLEQADTEGGPFNERDDEIYIQSFNNTRMGGYPPSNA